jgi:hypothetical protein
MVKGSHVDVPNMSLAGIGEADEHLRVVIYMKYGYWGYIDAEDILSREDMKEK